MCHFMVVFIDERRLILLQNHHMQMVNTTTSIGDGMEVMQFFPQILMSKNNTVSFKWPYPFKTYMLDYRASSCMLMCESLAFMHVPVLKVCNGNIEGH